jgi:hypothetical protein
MQTIPPDTRNQSRGHSVRAIAHDKACLRPCFLTMELERTRRPQRVLVPVSVPVRAPPTRHTITIEPEARPAHLEAEAKISLPADASL